MPLSLITPAQLPISFAPTHILLLLITGLLVILLYTYEPPITQTTILAFVPWIIVAAFLPLLPRFSGYPPYVVDLLTTPWAFFTAFVVPGLAWIILIDLTVGRPDDTHHPAYIATLGLGTAFILVNFVLTTHGPPSIHHLAFLLLIPLLALLGAIGITIACGLWHPDLLAYADKLAGFLIFGSLLDGAATIAGISLTDPTAHSWLSQTILGVITQYSLAAIIGLSLDLLWATSFITAKIAVAVAIAAILATYAKSKSAIVYPILGVVGAIPLAHGLATLIDLFTGV